MLGWLRLWAVWAALILIGAAAFWLSAIAKWEPAPRTSFDPPALLQILVDGGRLPPSRTLETRYSDLVDDLLPSDERSISFDAMVRLASPEDLAELEHRYSSHVTATVRDKTNFSLLLLGLSVLLSVAPFVVFRLIRWIYAGFKAGDPRGRA